jgi:hypothetical protein
MLNRLSICGFHLQCRDNFLQHILARRRFYALSRRTLLRSQGEFIPRLIVLRENPVIRMASAIPPRPYERASLAKNNRFCISFN